MEKLLAKPYKETSLGTNLNRIGDLVNFEGPILSLFEDVRTRHLYIFDWVDRDQRFNRWLIYRVMAKDLLSYLQVKLSYLDLFKSSVDKRYYFTDIGYSLGSGQCDLFEITEVPSKYFPNQDDYFDRINCTYYEKITFFVIERLKNQKQENEYIVSSNSLNRLTVKYKSRVIDPAHQRLRKKARQGVLASSAGKHKWIKEQLHNSYIHNRGINIISKSEQIQKIYKNEYSRVS
jgi:hypothetical protein